MLDAVQGDQVKEYTHTFLLSSQKPLNQESASCSKPKFSMVCTPTHLHYPTRRLGTGHSSRGSTRLLEILLGGSATSIKLVADSNQAAVKCRHNQAPFSFEARSDLDMQELTWLYMAQLKSTNMNKNKKN